MNTTDASPTREAAEYQVLVPELAKGLQLVAIDLVRYCGISMNTAYAALRGEVNLDTCWKIYAGLRRSGFKVEGVPVRWDHVVNFEQAEVA